MNRQTFVACSQQRACPPDPTVIQTISQSCENLIVEGDLGDVETFVRNLSPPPRPPLTSGKHFSLLLMVKRGFKIVVIPGSFDLLGDVVTVAHCTGHVCADDGKVNGVGCSGDYDEE